MQSYSKSGTYPNLYQIIFQNWLQIESFIA